jgi:hypothetical protein
MATYVEYTLDDGSTLLIETTEEYEGAIKAADDGSGNRIAPAERKFSEALASVKSAVATFRQELAALETDEVEVSFGLKVVSEGGLFAIARASAEVNYTVTLKWTKPEEDGTQAGQAGTASR